MISIPQFISHLKVYVWHIINLPQITAIEAWVIYIL